VARSALRPAVVAVVPLTAAMFWAMAWHLRRRMTADAVVGAENARLLATQRRFLQDASHQLRTPITIALGHAELLARQLADHPARRDIAVVVGELNRLRRLSERLLLIAACENPDFLLEEPVPLEQFAIEVLHRWRPAAARSWQLGQLDLVTVSADRERLGLAVDALLENAVRFTSEGDVIRLSVITDGFERTARLVVEDAGSGIPAGEVAHIFERFATGSGPNGHRGTGLGLTLVLAIARGHGGDVRAHSEAGQGSTFEIVLPMAARSGSDPADAGPGAMQIRGGT
jgi:signal transduction histidine kinase